MKKTTRPSDETTEAVREQICFLHASIDPAPANQSRPTAGEFQPGLGQYIAGRTMETSESMPSDRTAKQERAQHDSHEHYPPTRPNAPWGQIIRLTSTSALRTFELRRGPLSEQWLLVAITDTGAAAA